MKLNKKLYSLAFLAGLTLFTVSCDDDENNGGNDGGEETTVLQGSITEDVTLKSGQTYELTGAYTVEEGATLQILNGKTLTAGQAFTATVDGKMRAENASKVQGDVTIDGTGVVEVATADFSWTKGTFSGDWTK